MIHKVKVFSNWNLSSNFEYHKPIEIYVDTFPTTPLTGDIIRIIIIQEYHNTHGVISMANEKKDYYHYLFTHFDDVLKSNDRGVNFRCVNTWIEDYNFPNKTFGVSTVVGGKNYSNLKGHGLRHELWKKRSGITIPKQFYLSSHFLYRDADYKNNLVLGDKKEPLFDSMFHIAIENISMNNRFSEKILDAFQTKTIPIYWGTPNLGEFFDIEGVFVTQDVDEIINISNSLTPEIYAEKEKHIEANYIESMKYKSHTETLDRKLKEIFK